MDVTEDGKNVTFAGKGRKRNTLVFGVFFWGGEEAKKKGNTA